MPSNDRPSSRRSPGGSGVRPGGSSSGKGGSGRAGAPRGADGRPSGSGESRSGRPGPIDGARVGSGRQRDGRPAPRNARSADDSGARPAAGAARPGSRSSSARGTDRDEGPKTAGPKTWGSLGRRGAGRLSDSAIDNRNAVGATGRDERPDPGNEKIRWERVDDVRKEASGAVSRGHTGSRAAPGGPSDLAPKERRGRPARKPGAGTAGAISKDELVSALGATRGARANERLRDAAHAFERERFDESRKLLRPIAERAPQAAIVRELLGLTYYRLGRWTDANRELEAFRQLTGSTEQHPVLADSYRALKRRREVEDLWEELRESSPSADLVTEGRIVMAGSLADQGNFSAAITLLEKSQRSVKRAEIHHLRQAYALADLYERAGDIARARELFRWVLTYEPNFADAAERAGSLA